MEGIIPVSKSSLAMGRLCLQHLYNKKVLHIDDGDTFAASVGRDVHKWRAPILSGATDLETALAEITDPETKELLCYTIAKSLYPFEEGQKLEPHYHNEHFHGYIDRCGRVNGQLFVEDLKTGRYESDDEMERDLYSVLVWDEMSTKADDKLIFVRFFCRSGNHDIYPYSREEIEEARARVMAAVVEMRDAEPIPMPGSHCLRWYGRPCGYHGTEHCPLAADVPALVDATLPPTEMAAIGQAFMAIYRGLDTSDISVDTASLALQGVQQMEAAARFVEDALKEWSEDRGPIAIGKDKFGWYPVSDYEVNKPFALQALLLSEMTTDEIAKVVSISKTAIDKLISKRKYPNLRQSILDLAVSRSDGTKKRFGRIKD